MNRRDFIQKSLATGAVVAAGVALVSDDQDPVDQQKLERFKQYMAEHPVEPDLTGRQWVPSKFPTCTDDEWTIFMNWYKAS